jgi:hypothetical protein
MAVVHAHEAPTNGTPSTSSLLEGSQNEPDLVAEYNRAKQRSKTLPAQIQAALDRKDYDEYGRLLLERANNTKRMNELWNRIYGPGLEAHRQALREEKEAKDKAEWEQLRARQAEREAEEARQKTEAESRRKAEAKRQESEEALRRAQEDLRAEDARRAEEARRRAIPLNTDAPVGWDRDAARWDVVAWYDYSPQQVTVDPITYREAVRIAGEVTDAEQVALGYRLHGETARIALFHAVDPETTEVLPWAARWLYDHGLDPVDTYTTSLRHALFLFVGGTLQGEVTLKFDDGEMCREVYVNTQGATLRGQRLPGTPRHMVDAQEALDRIAAEAGQAPPPKAAAPKAEPVVEAPKTEGKATTAREWDVVVRQDGEVYKVNDDPLPYAEALALARATTAEAVGLHRFTHNTYMWLDAQTHNDPQPTETKGKNGISDLRPKKYAYIPKVIVRQMLPDREGLPEDADPVEIGLPAGSAVEIETFLALAVRHARLSAKDSRTVALSGEDLVRLCGRGAASNRVRTEVLAALRRLGQRRWYRHGDRWVHESLIEVDPPRRGFKGAKWGITFSSTLWNDPAVCKVPEDFVERIARAYRSTGDARVGALRLALWVKLWNKDLPINLPRLAAILGIDLDDARAHRHVSRVREAVRQAGRACRDAGIIHMLADAGDDRFKVMLPTDL